MTDRDKLLAIGLLLGDKPTVKKRSIEFSKWRRRFLTDELNGEILAVQEIIHYTNAQGNHQVRYETVARAEGTCSHK
jgi:hypothetical protein